MTMIEPGPQEEQPQADNAWVRWTPWICLFVLILLVFGPIWFVSRLHGDPNGTSPEGSGEATVGIAVILRATGRRLMRTASSGVLRTAIGTISRTAARTFTRQFVKLTVRILGAGFFLQMMPSSGKDATTRSRSRNAVSLLIGILALSASFAGVLALADPSVESALTVDQGLSRWHVSLLAGLPLLVYGVINLITGALLGVKIGFDTALDGLLLQAYFTGSGSFLPMTTDVVYGGTINQHATISIASISGLYFCHLGLATLSSPIAQIASGFFLVYCFVYAFPIKPLEGYDIWRKNKLLWFFLWLPILYAFVENLSFEFTELL